MSERQLNGNRVRQEQSGPAAAGGAHDTDELAGLRESAERLLGIADQAFEQIRAEDSREHVRRHRQNGGQ